ncbi:DUF2892 domain-containing protein [Fulvivirgaceae bacterium PWU20]|uniref:DUF2892 domain-containing protein n=2 Tax=Chryseosolibacter indicus TaxID=2782351 RepID=A0ABS5VK14_9BACT|nr:DUF2892 domain-containing protein [Chryseosolibacter indicus]
MEPGVMTDTMGESDVSMLTPATGSSNINVGSTERIASVLLGAAATVYGLRNLGSLSGIAMTIAGGMLVYRGASGYCMINNAIGRNTASRKTPAMEVRGTFTVNKPRAEVYAYWRHLENLPQFMKHLENVTVKDQIHSTWVARIPGGVGSVTWESEITEDRPGELITWSSLPGSTVDNAGEVRFQDAPDNMGTEIRVKITYRLPAGDVGTIAAKLFSPVVENMIKEDLRGFKSILETGEVPTVVDQLLGSEPDKSKVRKTKQSQSKKRTTDYTTSDSPIDQNTIQTFENNMLERD